MLEQQEKLWDFDAVEPGQVGESTLVSITAENISQYALVAQNPDSRYQSGGLGVPMPTMALTYAPLLRESIASNNGFVALEDSKIARRQTPFAKCEIRWFATVQAGDTITGNRSVLEKYERRGSKFVTFRVESVNQRGEKVSEYDYTCIFEYAKGQREVPPDSGAGQAAAVNDALARILSNSALLDFDVLSVGDELTRLDITESEEIILRKNDLRLAGEVRASNIHTDEEFARQNIFGGAVNSGPATLSYVDQMLEMSFPLNAFYNGGQLLMRAITPFRSGDTVTFQGEVTDKREEFDKKLVSCRVKGINQRGDLVCLSDVIMVMS